MPEEADYRFMKAGRLTCAVQSSCDPEMSPYGILLWSPGELVRKESTWLFHPELGLAGTMITVEYRGSRHRPEQERTTVAWSDPDSPGSGITIEWPAGDILVRERLSSIAEADRGGGLRREIELIAEGDLVAEGEDSTDAVLICGLYPNPFLFKGLPTHDTPSTLAVFRQGFDQTSSRIGRIPAFHLRLAASAGREVLLFERFVQIEGRVGKNGRLTATLEYRPGEPLSEDRVAPTTPERPGSPFPLPSRRSGPTDFTERIVRTTARSIQGISSVIDPVGRFDASIWQYGYEWGQDAAIVATALAYAGESELAWRVIGNILDRLVDAEGRVAESSRFRGGELAELNANGAVLSAVASCVALTGKTLDTEERIDAVRRVGDLVVDAAEQSRTGLLTGRRDLWERLPWMGVEEGADIATNSFVLRGLLDIIPLLRSSGETERAERWSAAAMRLREAMFVEGEPGFIDEGVLIHRRLSDGTPGRTMAEDRTWFDPAYRPYIPTDGAPVPEPRPSDPDSVAALPLLLDLWPADSPVARQTLDRLHRDLWDRTGIGGYLRSPLLSDPDSPGPWPFVTAWMAEAELLAGLSDRARATTDWLHKRAGEAGSWHEYYGPRRAPAPPLGIIVWGWAQYLLLVVRGWYGIRLIDGTLHITPRLAPVEFSTLISGRRLTLEVTDHEATPIVEGSDARREPGSAILTLPLSGDTHITFG